MHPSTVPEIASRTATEAERLLIRNEKLRVPAHLETINSRIDNYCHSASITEIRLDDSCWLSAEANS